MLRRGWAPDLDSGISMHFRSIIGGAIALLLSSGALALAAGDSSGRMQVEHGQGARMVIDLPGVFGSRDAGAYQVAQAGDPRITALEEQIRSLSGTVEELNFQVLQMQEQLRKIQEDNEFRFQELEKGSGAAPKPNQTMNQSAPSATSHASAETRSSAPATTGIAPGAQANTRPNGLPERTFGTITFDANGNVIGGSVGDQATLEPTPGIEAQPDQAQVAALPQTNSPDELYRNSYEFILSGDYGTAEAGFRDHIARFPDDPQTADAQFWLGEALLGQQKYRDAAEVFLAASKNYPKSKKAPEMMLKLGISLVGLDQKDVACATFGEINKRYPNISRSLKDRVAQEKALAAC